MEKTMILCRSMTHAQRSQRLLERIGIPVTVIKAPLHLTKSGCGYAIQLRKHGPEAIKALKEAGLLSGKVYIKTDGDWREKTDDLS